MLKYGLTFGCVALVCAILVAVFLVIRVKSGGCPNALIVKTVASIVFMVGGLIAVYYNGLSLANLFVVIGLLFALIGDIVLDLKVAYGEHKKTYLNCGMISFSMSSLMYFISIILYFYTLKNFGLSVIGYIAVALAFASIVLLLEKRLKLDFIGYKVQVFVYSTLVSLVALMGLGIGILVTRFLIFAVGAVLILLSDLVLSMIYFGDKKDSKTFCVINHTLYYIGELMIVAYLFFQFV